MRIRFSCLLVGAAILALGTMAFAQPLIGVTCNGGVPTNVCTITETLYFPGNSGGGVATSTQDYVAPSAGNTSGTNLVAGPAVATYSFDNYGFFNTAGDTFVSAKFQAMDATTGSVSLQGTNTWYAYSIAAQDTFSFSSVFSGHIIVDTSTAAGSSVATSGGCQDDSATTNGAVDSTGCVYLTASASPVVESGFNNTSVQTTSNTLLAPFEGSGTSTVYEQIEGVASISGPTPNTDAPNSATGASEAILSFTYDVPNGTPPTGTPEPTTLLLLGTGLSFVASRLRRNKSEAK